MSTSRRAIGTAAILALVVLTARCAEPGTATGTVPAGAGTAVTTTIGTPDRLVASAPALVACPNHAERVVSRVVDAAGGSFGIAGTSISIPAGAVPRPTTFTLRLPRSGYMELDLRADGAEHYTFAAPVQVTVNYARCSATGSTPYSAWYIDGASHQLLQRMDGQDDRRGHKLTFTTDHFSGYALAE